MKIDRLLSILIYLLNRDLVSARELADHYAVSIRTIQRDMDALTFAGIPIHAVHGSQGGYGIMKSYKLDRQLVNTDDLFFILTALESVSKTFQNPQIGDTLEKIKSLVHDYQAKEIDRRKEELYIDMSAMGLKGDNLAKYQLLEKSISLTQTVIFDYHSTRLEITRRQVEPMTLIFCWYSWYMFGFCLLRNDFRLFRISRIQNLKTGNKCFTRKQASFSRFLDQLNGSGQASMQQIILKFAPAVGILIKDYFRDAEITRDEKGCWIIKTRLPEDDWVCGMVLSYGDQVEVLAPNSLKLKIIKTTQSILKKYDQD